MEAPSGRQAIWSPDSHSLVLMGSYAPLGEDRERRQKGPFHFEYNLENGAITPLPSVHAVPIAWDPATGFLRFLDHDGSQFTLSRRGGTWTKVDNSASLRPFEVTVEEDMNHPPKVWATPAGGHRKLLLDCNPQLAAVTLAPVSEIQWLSKDGRPCHGGMFLPAAAPPGSKFPLVIQTHG